MSFVVVDDFVVFVFKLKTCKVKVSFLVFGFPVVVIVLVVSVVESVVVVVVVVLLVTSKIADGILQVYY